LTRTGTQERVKIEGDATNNSFYLPSEWVNRANEENKKKISKGVVAKRFSPKNCPCMEGKMGKGKKPRISVTPSSKIRERESGSNIPGCCLGKKRVRAIRRRVHGVQRAGGKSSCLEASVERIAERYL